MKKVINGIYYTLMAALIGTIITMLIIMYLDDLNFSLFIPILGI